MSLIKLSEYLSKQKAALDKIKKHIASLDHIHVPLCVEVYNESIGLFSDDYSLATDFIIKKRTNTLEDVSGYDGGYHTDLIEYYPQFYFNIKGRQVLIRHKGFDTDKRIVIKSVKDTRGYKLYANETRTIENSVDYDAVLIFFKKKSVKSKLLNKLKKRISELW
jgi:hypothetical protein